MRKEYTFNPDYAISPGKILLDSMESSEMNTPEFMEKSGLSLNTLYEIITGEQHITNEIAVMLERATYYSVEMWNNLESNYREQLDKIEENK